MVLLRKTKKPRHIKERCWLYFSWISSSRLSLAYLLISSRPSMEVFLGRKAARTAPESFILGLHLTPWENSFRHLGAVGMLVTPSHTSLLELLTDW